MDSNSALVDDFLRGGGAPTSIDGASRSSMKGRPMFPDDGNSKFAGGCATPAAGTQQQQQQPPAVDANILMNAFALQQKLVSLMNEAQVIVQQLQQCGMFPRVADGDSATSVTMLLTSLLQHGNSNSSNNNNNNMNPAAMFGNDMTASSISGRQSNGGAASTWDSSADASNLMAMLSGGVAGGSSATAAAAGSGAPGSNHHHHIGEEPLTPFDFNSMDPAAAAAYQYVEDDNSFSDIQRVQSVGGAGVQRSNSNSNMRHQNDHKPWENTNNHHNIGGIDDNGEFFEDDNGNSGTLQPQQQQRHSPLPDNVMFAFVEFKRGRVRKYVCEREEIEPGAYVLVDGDRGTDCGLLVQTIKHAPNGDTAVLCMDGCDVKDDRLKLENGRVLRAASSDDIERLHNIIAAAEAVALKTCRQRCEELGISIELVDVEYQFDMKKISFFFNCDHSVDFRNLVRELYRTFGARIWMENVNPKVRNSMPENGNGNAGGGQYQRKGESGDSRGGARRRGGRGSYRGRN